MNDHQLSHLDLNDGYQYHGHTSSRFLQTGIIGFSRGSLVKFNDFPETKLEIAESVDMNRVLENGEKIRMALTENITLGVDIENDILIAQKLMKSDKYIKSYINKQS